MTQPKELHAFLLDLMPHLGKMARKGFENPGPVMYKRPGNPVTETDRAIEAEAKRAILATFPTHKVEGEESGVHDGESDIRWHIDPIDGTLNFTRGIPFFSVSIGVERNGVMLAGAVLDPLRNELFHGYPGGGAWIGDRPAKLGSARRLDEATLSMQTSAGGDFMRTPGFLLEIHRRLQKTRKLGTIALELAYVAAGRMDLLFAGKYRPQAWWDIAGGWAVVEAAGGVLRDLEGQTVSRESTQLVAGRPDLVEQMVEMFAQFPASPVRRET